MDRTIRIIKGKIIKPILQTVKLGSIIEAMAKPIAVALKKDCVDTPEHQLKKGSDCWKRKQKLNGET